MTKFTFWTSQLPNKSIKYQYKQTYCLKSHNHILCDVIHRNIKNLYFEDCLLQHIHVHVKICCILWVKLCIRMSQLFRREINMWNVICNQLKVIWVVLLSGLWSCDSSKRGDEWFMWLDLATRGQCGFLNETLGALAFLIPCSCPWLDSSEDSY